MDSAIAGLIGAGIGAAAGMVGTIVGQAMQSRRDLKKWHLGKKEDAYSNTLRFLLKVLNRRSQITATGITYIAKDDILTWFQDVSEAQAWLTSLTIVCSSDVRDKVINSSESLNKAMSSFLGTEMKVGEEDRRREMEQLAMGSGRGPDFGSLSEAVVFAYEQVLESARIDLGKHIA